MTYDDRDKEMGEDRDLPNDTLPENEEGGREAVGAGAGAIGGALAGGAVGAGAGAGTGDQIEEEAEEEGTVQRDYTMSNR